MTEHRVNSYVMETFTFNIMNCLSENRQQLLQDAWSNRIDAA